MGDLKFLGKEEMSGQIFGVVSIKNKFCLAATKESGRIRWLRKPPQPSLQEVCEEGLRVHPDGRG